MTVRSTAAYWLNRLNKLKAPSCEEVFRGSRYNESKFKLYLKTYSFAIFHRKLNKLSSVVTAMQAKVSDREINK